MPVPVAPKAQVNANRLFDFKEDVIVGPDGKPFETATPVFPRPSLSGSASGLAPLRGVSRRGVPLTRGVSART